MVSKYSEIDIQSPIYCPSCQITAGSQEQGKMSISLERLKFIPLYKVGNELPKDLFMHTVYSILKNDQES